MGEQHISFPAFDDERSISRTRVIYTSFFWTVLSYPSGLVLVINSLLAVALGSLLVIALVSVQVLLAGAVGAIVFLVAAAFQYRLAIGWYNSVRKDWQPRFPPPASPKRPKG